MRVDKIKSAVAKEFEVKQADLIGDKRTREKVMARQVAYFLVKNLLDWSHREIGEKFARDHTTVGFGIRQIRRDMRRNKILKLRVIGLQESLIAGKA